MTDGTPLLTLLSDLIDPTRLEAALDIRATALTDGTSSLSWGDYAARVAQVAAVLADQQVRPGDRVAVRLNKSCQSFVAVHAVIRAGAVVVPLDPLAPTHLAAAIVADAGAEVLITERRMIGLADELPGLRCVIVPGAVDLAAVSIGDGIQVIDESGIAGAEPTAAVDVDPTDPAYIIYTSGSTGTPKGIVHSHASALAYARAAVDEYELDAHDRLANIAPLHFDQSTFELYAAPLAGAMVLVVPDPVLRFPASVTDLIARERITVWYSVPYLLEQISDRGALDDRDLGSLRWVLYGGEAFPPSALATLMARLPDARVSNVYGPAEVNQCTAHHLTSPPSGPVPIGRAWRAAEIRLVDPDDRTVEIDDPGQNGVITVSTPTMMTGYWNMPELTEAAITVGPDGSRWYDTGDLARAREDGVLEFLGRVDHQVKLRGHRIELEAVDAVLRDVPGVTAAAAVVDRPDDADDRLVALVEGADDTPSIEQIAELLRSRLPRYAVPADIRIVESLPRTATGKIDRPAALVLVERSE